ncbi:MAG TPA: competence protein [candidate division WOR-3 bacterium]|uniref:Competence protein n=1 Tax=candidate division WOR-3 bacterium TaxID=2052148 RepID=A0A9C9EPT0_UNCW3|nr:competence protein [candidate division WOR-3 bacterium]
MEEKKYENYIEKIVREELKKLYEKDETLCKCDKCFQDIMTLTLNNLPPMYVSSDVGHIVTMYNLTKDQLQAQVMVELLKAVEQVKKSPKH